MLKIRNHPPMYHKADLKKFDITSLGKFDVILIDPPWEEYFNRVQGLPIMGSIDKLLPWSFDEIGNLPID